MPRPQQQTEREVGLHSAARVGKLEHFSTDPHFGQVVVEGAFRLTGLAGCDDGERSVWRTACELLLASAEDQPAVFVHRDFHSCNLMDTGDDRPGIIDFQDAVVGPISYDLISLLLDRYISWPRPSLEEWLDGFRVRLGLTLAKADWLQRCDWMALQRNLKVVGIFARLNYRDGKPQYLDDLPLVLEYLLETCANYTALAPLNDLLLELHPHAEPA